jgi:hypothetical protein
MFPIGNVYPGAGRYRVPCSRSGVSRVALARQYREAEGLSLDAMTRWRELYGRLPSSYDCARTRARHGGEAASSRQNVAAD